MPQRSTVVSLTPTTGNSVKFHYASNASSTISSFKFLTPEENYMLLLLLSTPFSFPHDLLATGCDPLNPSFLVSSPHLAASATPISRYSICIIGFFLATFSLYSILNFHPEKNLDNGRLNGDSEVPKLTIFSAPRPLISSNRSDLTWARQKLAVRSWLALSDNVDVVLFGRHPSIFELREGYSSRVMIEPAIDFTYRLLFSCAKI